MNSMTIKPQTFLDPTTTIYTMSNTSAFPNWSSSLHAKTLAEVNQEKADTLLPACIFLASLAIFGLIGNSLVCYVFGARLRPGTQNSLIVCLAVFDLLSCALGIPNEIADMQLYFTYSSEAACKIMRFINMFTALGSVFTLLFIAIDRYRKVCLPFERQLHMHHMKIFVVPVIMGGALFLSWPSLLVYGLRSADTGYPGLTGTDCSAAEALRGTMVPLIYNSVLFGGFIVIVVALACLYIKVLRGVRRLNRNRLMRRKRCSGIQTAVSDGSMNSTPRRVRDARRYELTSKEAHREIQVESTGDCKDKDEVKLRESSVNSCSDGKEGKERSQESNVVCSQSIVVGKEEDNSTLNGYRNAPTLISDKTRLGNKVDYTNNWNQSNTHISSLLHEDSNKELCKEICSSHNSSKDINSQSSCHDKARTNNEDRNQKDLKLIKCRPKPFKRQLSFPLTRTFENFGYRYYTSSPGPPEKLDINPLIKILRRNIASDIEITDTCPILKCTNHEESGCYHKKASHLNKSYSVLKTERKIDKISRQRKTSEIIRGEAIGLEELGTLTIDLKRPSLMDIQIVPNPRPRENVSKDHNNEPQESFSNQNNNINSHAPSEKSFVSHISEYDQNCIPTLPSQDCDKARDFQRTKTKGEETCSELRRTKMIRFNIDPNKDLPSPDSCLCQKIEGNAQNTANSSSIKDDNQSNSLRSNNFGDTYDNNGMHCSNCGSLEITQPYQFTKCINNKNSASSRKKPTTSRIFRPLNLSRAGYKFQSICPPSSVRNASSTGQISKITATATSTPNLGPKKPASKLTGASEAAKSTPSRSSFAVSVASSCTIDSHYSRISSSPPDDIERSTSSSATLSTHSRHRHNDSRKLRGHRGHGPRSRTTTIALLVTLIFVASFLPHLCLQAAQLINERFATNLRGSASLAYNTFLRSYFINSAANPVLYGILNVKFSAEVRALMGRG